MSQVSGNNTITTLERLKAMPGVFIQTIKQGKSVWFAIGELVDLITGKADKPITGTDVPTDPPAYEGQICSVYNRGYPCVFVGVKTDTTTLGWRQVAISGSRGEMLPPNSIVIGGTYNVIGNNNQSSGVFCGVNNEVSSQQSVVLGGASNKVSGTASAVLGGSGCKASGTQSVVLCGSGCHATGAMSATLGGNGCKANAYSSAVIAGIGNNIDTDGSLAVILGGDGNNVGGAMSVILGGSGCKTTQLQQVAMGQNNDPDQDNGNVVFMVGCGASKTARANAFTISNTGIPKAMAGQYNVPCCKTGITAPSTAPDYVGQEYLDAAQKKVYKAFGTTDASDWVALN